MRPKPKLILGQKPSVLLAVWQNILSWLVKSLAPSYLPRLLPKCPQEEAVEGKTTTSASTSTLASASTSISNSNSRTRCISIGRPGGVEQLRVVTLQEGIMTCGYNVKGQDLPYTKPIRGNDDIPADCVVLRNEAFSVNYADCCIRYVHVY